MELNVFLILIFLDVFKELFLQLPFVQYVKEDINLRMEYVLRIQMRQLKMDVLINQRIKNVFFAFLDGVWIMMVSVSIIIK
jgi:hypothetical protein